MEHHSALALFIALADCATALSGQGHLNFNVGNARYQGPHVALKASKTGAMQPPSVHTVDVDANLLHPDLVDDIELHLEVAASVGVMQFVVPGSTVSDSAKALELARQKPNVIFPTAGVHPYHVHDSGTINSGMEAIAALATNATVRCVGECGLDFSEGFPSKELQQEWFERQVKLACELGKPLFLHERKAFKPFVEVLSRYNLSHGLPPCLIHCFTGTQQELSVYLDMGFFVGVTGFLCKKNHGSALREAVKTIPIDRLMVETDAPFLGFPGCRARHSNDKKQNPNVPSALPCVVRMLACCLELPEEEVARRTAENSRKFFGMEPPSSL